MPEITRFGRAIWPGVVGATSCTYYTAQGITPGKAILSINPQPGVDIAEEGDLILLDGVTTVPIRGCRVEALKRSGDTQHGWVDTIEILDHRWTWTLGAINGTYNQLDTNKKLEPWTIRSPYELAVLCLEQMGETNYEINLPPGLTRADGLRHYASSPPWYGVIPFTGTNPPVNWLGEIPAQALQWLCQQFGRRVIWQWRTGKVLITVPYVGAALPPGSIASTSPAIKSALQPSGIGIIGAPTRFQTQFLMEPVGEEWHGALIPIDQLSYAPIVPARGQTAYILARTGAGATLDDRLGGVGAVWRCSLAEAGVDPLSLAADRFTYTVVGGDSLLGVLTELVNQIDASVWGGRVTTSIVDWPDQPFDSEQRAIKIVSTSTIEPRFRDFTVGAEFGPLDVGGVWQPTITVAGASQRRSWTEILPSPLVYYNAVTPTPNLTKLEAARLAEKHIWKTFRIKANPDGSLPIQIPGYGAVARRQQVILENTKVEQITSADLVADVVRTRLENEDIAFNFYNGYSHDRPLSVYGTVSIPRTLPGVFWPGTGTTGNTDPSRPLLFQFSVDPVEQTISCGEQLFKDLVAVDTSNDVVADPQLILETACTIRNVNSNALECFVATKPFPARNLTPVILEGDRNIGITTVVGFAIHSRPTNYAWHTYADVQANVIGHYGTVETQRRVVAVTVGEPIVDGSAYNIGIAELAQAPFGAAATVVQVRGGGAFGNAFRVLRELGNQINASVWGRRGMSAVVEMAGPTGVQLTITGPPKNITVTDAQFFFECAATVDPVPNTMVANKTTDGTLGGIYRRLEGATILERDPFMRASYYLAGLTEQYIAATALTNKYNGLEPIDLDGAIQQVSWTVDVNGGCDTVASRNCDHSVYYPPYPQRLRAEFLRAQRHDTFSRSPTGDPYVLLQALFSPRSGT